MVALWSEGVTAARPIPREVEVPETVPEPARIAPEIPLPSKLEIRGHMGMGVEAAQVNSYSVVERDFVQSSVVPAKNAAELEKKVTRAVDALEAFTGNGYEEIRKTALLTQREWLQRFPQWKKEDYLRFKDLHAGLEEWLSLSPSFPSQEILYRGMVYKKEIFDALEVGDRVPLQAAASFTDNPVVAGSFVGNAEKDAILELESSASRVASSVTFVSQQANEREVLVSGRNILEIIGKEIDEEGYLHIRARVTEVLPWRKEK